MYADGENWLTFYDPDFTPIFEPSFTDPDLEELANTLCGDDVFCRYDIATTGRAEIGMSTQQGGQEFEELIELSKQSMFYAKFALVTFMSFYKQLYVTLLVNMVLAWRKMFVHVEKVTREIFVMTLVRMDNQ